jgi:hypothetical protein
MKSILSIAIILLAFSSAATQEISCDVTLNLEALTTAEARENLSDFKQQLNSYINTHRWTNEDFGDEKIFCSIDVLIIGATGNQYAAKVFLGSKRPIYKSGNSSAVLRLVDDKWEFEWIRNQSITHIENRFDPLLSFIDFYIYLILGFDADTYAKNGGTQYFERANDIINYARSAANPGKGWESTTQGIYSRAQLVDELLNPKFESFRKAVHTYYYRGLDSLFGNKERALKKMYSALDNIRNLLVKNNQPSLAVRTFFDTKYLEIAEAFLDYSDETVYTRLVKIDPVHQSTYEEYAKKRK